MMNTDTIHHYSLLSSCFSYLGRYSAPFNATQSSYLFITGKLELPSLQAPRLLFGTPKEKWQGYWMPLLSQNWWFKKKIVDETFWKFKKKNGTFGKSDSFIATEGQIQVSCSSWCFDLLRFPTTYRSLNSIWKWSRRTKKLYDSEIACIMHS